MPARGFERTHEWRVAVDGGVNVRSKRTGRLLKARLGGRVLLHWDGRRRWVHVRDLVAEPQEGMKMGGAAFALVVFAAVVAWLIHHQGYHRYRQGYQGASPAFALDWTPSADHVWSAAASFKMPS